MRTTPVRLLVALVLALGVTTLPSTASAQDQATGGPVRHGVPRLRPGPHRRGAGAGRPGDHHVRRRRAARRRHPPGRYRTVPHRAHHHRLRQVERCRRLHRRERGAGRPRLRHGRGRRSRHRLLGREVGLVGPPHGGRLPGDHRLDRVPAVERRCDRRDRRVVHGHHVAVHGGEPTARGQGRVRHGADGRQLPRHRVRRRRGQHRVHPALGRPRHRPLARAGKRSVDRARASGRGHRLPAAHHLRLGPGRRHGLRRPVLASAVTHRARRSDPGPHLHRRWPRRPVPAW